MTNILLKSGKLLLKAGNLALNGQSCCCGATVGCIINICNANKWSDTARDAKINSNTLTAPTNDSNGACGGGYYWSNNITPDPDYCSWGTIAGVGLICCGSQVGGTSSTCTGCDGASYSGHTYTAGAYPATGCKGEDCGCSGAGGYSNFQTNCSLGDCSGDLTKQGFNVAWLNIPGSNTFTSAMTASGRCSGDYGVVQVFKVVDSGSGWVLSSVLVNSTYSSSTFSATFSL